MAFLFRDGVMAHAFWNHEHFAFVELNRTTQTATSCRTYTLFLRYRSWSE